ncbi:cellulose biosynthesis protein BcsR [Pantoea sp. MBD-2R]|uniref:cellulose biosynthesis protein BcsR n=1 Tax=unclassified Pantoea TaxID=2630326 RepID=UPI0011BEA7AE|nr:cellulose biosynthesis protein BcsR [Pantoea sp. CCBC3-3-1]
MTEQPNPKLPVAREAQDDIRALEKAFSLQNWHYIDIARQERLAGILTRWPLLAEFATAVQIKSQQ